MYEEFETVNSVLGSSEALTPRPSMKRKLGDTVQQPLENFLGAGGSILSRAHRPDVNSASHNLLSVKRPGGLTRNPRQSTIVARRLVVDEVVKPPCSCSDPSSPRLEPPVGPYSWAKRWNYTDGAGAYLLYEPVYDIRKAKLLESRMLISRKRTTNVFDLASVWRKQQISSLLAGNPIEDPAVLNEWSENV
jgi:hypothetical protein